MARLGDIVKQIRGVSYSPNDLYDSLNENSVVLLRANNIRDGQINYDDIVFIDKKKVSKEQYLRQGDILVCASSGSKELVGKAAYISKNLPVTFGAFCKVVRPINTLQAEYISHFFQSAVYRRKISESSAGANINNIRNEHIDTLELELPSENEQNRISYILNHVTALIAMRKKQLRKLDDLVKARFVEMFIGKGYPEVTIHDVLETAFWLMPATPEFIADGEIPYITSKNIKNRQIDFDHVKYISKTTYDVISANRPTMLGDILVSMIGTLGQTAVITDNRLFYGQNLYLLRLNNSVIDTDYFCEFFNSNEAQHILQSKRNQSTQAYLKANHVEDLILPLPPLELQKHFAAFVHQVDKSKLSIQQSLGKLETLKQSLMQKYFG